MSEKIKVNGKNIDLDVVDSIVVETLKYMESQKEIFYDSYLSE